MYISIFLPMCDIFPSIPEGYKGKYGSQFSLHVFFGLQCHTIVQILYTVVCKQCRVIYCKCTDVFTVITTNDQSGGIYNSYSTVRWPEIYGCSKQTSSSGYALGLGPFHSDIIITYTTVLVFS